MDKQMHMFNDNDADFLRAERDRVLAELKESTARVYALSGENLKLHSRIRELERLAAEHEEVVQKLEERVVAAKMRVGLAEARFGALKKTTAELVDVARGYQRLGNIYKESLALALEILARTQKGVAHDSDQSEGR
jgi:uncharacterized coiled-coil protein SlyX